MAGEGTAGLRHVAGGEPALRHRVAPVLDREQRTAIDRARPLRHVAGGEHVRHDPAVGGQRRHSASTRTPASETASPAPASHSTLRTAPSAIRTHPVSMRRPSSRRTTAVSPPAASMPAIRDR